MLIALVVQKNAQKDIWLGDYLFDTEGLESTTGFLCRNCRNRDRCGKNHRPY